MASTPEYPPAGPAPEPGFGVAADLELALRLAESADAVTTGRFRAADLVVSSKPDLSPVSDADQAVERLIRQRLASERPADAFCGEESGTSGSGPRRWVLDPIDGTKNFVRGVPVWATLLALLVDDEPVLGVVSAPALGQRWWAAAGRARSAAPSARRPGRCGSRGSAGSPTPACPTPRCPAGPSRAASRPLLELIGQVWRSPGLRRLLVLHAARRGRRRPGREPELSLWDMAALAPIVTEAGGRFTGLNGVDGVQQGNAAASNGLLHSRATGRAD